MADNAAEEGAVRENPLQLFATESNHMDVEVRINSIKKLSTVAMALDVDKTKNELIPYLDNLTEEIYNDDEILMNLAEQLGSFLPYIGGAENVDLILKILEKLATVDEIVVRDKAIESLEKIAEQLDVVSLESKFVPMIFRLIESDWFTSKCSGAALCSICYPLVSDNIKTELRTAYRILCEDDSPLVRRAAATKLVRFAPILETHWLINEFVPICYTFAKDDQDSVRLLAVDVAVSVASCLNPKEIEDLILTTLTELCGDPSWRVRYQVANQMNLLQRAFGCELTHKYLLVMFQNLVHDTEPQVREATTYGIVGFCELLQKWYRVNNQDGSIDPIIINQMFPLIKLLDQDCNSDVKESLSNVITMLSPLLGHEYTKLLLLPLITSSLINDSSKVRENIISNLNNIISIIGMNEIADTVLDIIADLVNNSASIWRTRRNLVVTINYIAKDSGKEYFDKHLKALYHKLLNDGVYAVRKTAPLILPILIKNFGFKWAKESILQDIIVFSRHKHYLYRYVCLFCIDELVSPTLEVKMNSVAMEINQLKYLEHVCNTKSGNDKIATFLKRIKKLNTDLQLKFKDDWVCDILTHLQNNSVSDDDIKTYAEGLIDTFKKDHTFNVTSISIDDISKDEVYMEELLDLILNKIMDVLYELSHDPVDNVHSLVGKTLSRIVQLSKTLETELNDPRLEIFEDACKEENEITGEECEVQEMGISTSKERNESEGDEKSLESEIIDILEEKIKAVE
ncbi:hypothetical protein FQA39_LY14122 [Lamprigera yunnana]|nr:hypothetical protein FQA39_LY14122 [Lamprigera yunnana]